MDELLMQKTCTDFVTVLASKEPVPGGGGACALVGAIGTALGSMTGNFTLGKKKYAAVEADIKRLLAKGQELQKRLLDLVEADAAAFAPLAKAYSIPKDDPKRTDVLEAATRNACVAPLKIMEASCEALDLLAEMREKGSVMLVSDVGCGAICCKAALQCASLNIFINTKSLQDRAYARELENKVDEMLTEYGRKADEIAAAVVKKLREE